MKILALDQATQTGWAVGDGRSFENKSVMHGVVRIPKRASLGERLVCFDDRLIDLIESHKPDLIAYEEPYWPFPGAAAGLVDNNAVKGILARLKKGGTFPEAYARLEAMASKDSRPPASAAMLQFLQKVEAIVQMRAARASIPAECYRSATWRVTALGTGRAPKGSEPGELKRMMVAKAKMLGYQVETEDEADAIGILMHSLHGAAANERMQTDLWDAAEERLK